MTLLLPIEIQSPLSTRFEYRFYQILVVSPSCYGSLQTVEEMAVKAKKKSSRESEGHSVAEFSRFLNEVRYAHAKFHPEHNVVVQPC